MKKKSKILSEIEQIVMGESLNKSGDYAQTLSWTTYLNSINPGGSTLNEGQKNTAYTQARNYANRHFWLSRFVELKESILLYGLRIVPQVIAKMGKKGGTGKTPSKAGKNDVDTLDAWLETAEAPDVQSLTPAQEQTLGIPSGTPKKNLEYVLKFIWDATREIIIQRNCIAYWSKDKWPICLALESCRYLDTFGVERLFYKHGLDADQKKLLPPAQQERFKKDEVAVDSRQGEFFKVYKTERDGYNLGWPSIQPIFNVLETTLNMESAEVVLSYLGRAKWRHWKLGYEIKGGPHAGKKSNHITKERARLVSQRFENKVGCMNDYVTNFDVDISYPVEPLDYYKEEKWSSSMFRFIQWGGSIAKLIVSAEGVTPYLTKLLKAEIQKERQKLKIFLDTILQLGFPDSGVPMQVKFSNMIFMDSRLEAEILKSGLAGGPITQSTWRDESGFDDERERGKKETEGNDAKTNPQFYAPAFDAAHGPADQSLNPKGGAPAGNQNIDNTGTRNT